MIDNKNTRIRHLYNASVQSVKQALEEEKQLILRHMTSTSFYESINSNGLLIPQETGNVFNDGLPADPGCVYLMPKLEDSYYLNRAVKQYGGKGLIVEVRVDIQRLLPNECILFGAQRSLPLLEQLYASLCGDSCKHSGSINRNQIVELIQLE